MKNHSSKGKKTTPIKIDDRLYDLLRKFCDKEGRRLIDFVEDALRNKIFKEKRSQI
jgi:hypothetical protein